MGKIKTGSQILAIAATSYQNRAMPGAGNLSGEMGGTLNTRAKEAVQQLPFH